MSAPQPTTRRPCFAVRLCAELKRLIALAALLGLVLIAGKYYCFDRLNEEIRARVEGLLRDHYAGLAVSVKSARRVPGQGVEIRGVRIAEAGGRSAPVIAEIDEIFAECDTRLPDFLTKPPQVTALRLHRLKLRAERKPSGRWNVAHLLPLPPCQSVLAPAASISDGSLEIVDPTQAAVSGGGGLMLRNIELSIKPHGNESLPSSNALLNVRGTLAGDHVERVEIDGTLDPVTSRWELRGAVQGLEFSPRMRSALPHELGDILAPLSSIRGRTFFGFQASRGARSSDLAASPQFEFSIHGRISEGRIDDTRLPEPLTDVEATLRCNNQGITIDELSARCGPTQIELSAALTGYGGGPTDVRVVARQVQLERLPLAALPPAVAQAWQQFQPHGLADVAGRLHFDGRQWLPDLAIECRNLAVCYERFAYRLTDGTGTIVVKPASVAVKLQMLGGGRPVHCRAEIIHPGPHFSGWIEAQSDGPVTIDERLLVAMEPATQRLVRSFRPRGSATFLVRLERAPNEAALRRKFQFELCDCSIQHDRFPYPIDRINGVISFQNDKWLFQKLTGRNDSAEISGEGWWQEGNSAERQLTLKFAARDVPLANELRQALPLSAQRLWTNLQPRGNIDQLFVDLHYQPAAAATGREPWSLDVRAEKLASQNSGEGRSISLEPLWFPYSLNHVSGALRYRDGRLDLANFKAVHGHASLGAEGNCVILPTGGCVCELTKLDADRVEFDADLLSALPGGLGQSLARFPLEGPVGIRGTINITVPPRVDALPQLAWDLMLDVENGRLTTTVPVEHIHGGVRLMGRQLPEGMFARGELQVDSALIRGVQLTSVQGPFWLDGQRLVFGALAERDANNRAPRQITARTMSGLLSLDGELLLVGGSHFDLEATLANADLTAIAQELAPHHRGLSGKVYGLVHVQGEAEAKHTWQGAGKISLREANLYELPAMVTLLKLLSIQRPDSTAFTNSNIDFRVEGDDLAFDRIDFSGDAISLKGKGRLSGQRQIDLKFYPIVGRAERQWPILRPLLGETGREFMLIEVTGTMDQPFVHRQVFPRLDAQLAQLFPELAREQPVESTAPAVTSARSGIQGLLPSRWR